MEKCDCCFREYFPEIETLKRCKSEIFENHQNINDYFGLESKFISLKNQIYELSYRKNNIKKELEIMNKQRNRMVNDLQNENNRLRNNLNEINIVNNKLYGENNNLFQDLEKNEYDSKYLQDRLYNQDIIIKKLLNEKTTLINNIKLKELRSNNIINNINKINEQINLLENNSQKLDDNLNIKNNSKKKKINKIIY